jgi:hypothetical protein
VWVLISGKGKEEALKKTLLPTGITPLGRVMSLRKQTTIYTDVQTGLKNNGSRLVKRAFFELS